MYWISCFHNKKAFLHVTGWIEYENTMLTNHNWPVSVYNIYSKWNISYAIHSWNRGVAMDFRWKSWHRQTFDGKNIFHFILCTATAKLTNAVSLAAKSSYHSNVAQILLNIGIFLARIHLDAWKLFATFGTKNPNIVHMNSVWLGGERHADVHLRSSVIIKQVVNETIK